MSLTNSNITQLLPPPLREMRANPAATPLRDAAAAVSNALGIFYSSPIERPLAIKAALSDMQKCIVDVANNHAQNIGERYAILMDAEEAQKDIKNIINHYASIGPDLSTLHAAQKLQKLSQDIRVFILG